MKTLTTIIIGIIISFFSFGQPDILLQKTIGGSSNDYLYSMLQSTDGGYMLSGYSNSGISGDKSEICYGNVDYWIVKTDSAGNVMWENTIGANDKDHLYAAKQTSDGGYILGGYSNSIISGDKTENSSGIDFWIIKTDANGVIQWQSTIGGNADDRLFSLQQTSDGGYIFGGYSNSPVSLDKTEDTIGGFDYWIVKTNSTGTILWQNTIGGTGSDLLRSIAQTPDGGYILGGYSNSDISGDKTENSKGDYDYWIVKTDGTGSIQWQKTIGGSGYDELDAMQRTSDGGYIIGGSSSSNISGDKTTNSKGDLDYWIVKTDNTGNVQWEKTIGGDTTDALTGIEQLYYGGYAMSGSSLSNKSGDKTENSNGGYDYWIVKTDDAGTIQWQNTIGGSGDDEALAMQTTADNNYAIGGFSNSNISGDKTENKQGGFDYWMVKVRGSYNFITGSAFVDFNNNQVFDAGDINLQGEIISEMNTNNFALSNKSLYNIEVFDSGSYTVVPAPISYFNAVPATRTATFNGVQLTDSLNNFAFQPIPGINDLRITLTPYSAFHAGNNARYRLHFKNIGTNTINNVSVVFYINDTNYTYVSASTTPSLVTTDSLVWNNITLGPWERGHINIIVNVKPGVPKGTELKASCVITPVAGDSFPKDNYDTWKTYVTNSAFASDKLVSDTALILPQITDTTTYLDYVIRFQNIGTDTAINIKILDTIPPQLDISTFKIVVSTGLFNLYYNPVTRLMTFAFDSIMLPNKATNDLDSRGFIRYRMKPYTTLTVADTIRNTSLIYFDANPPLQTNTVTTTIIDCNTSFAAINFSSAQFCTAYPVNATAQLLYPSDVIWYVDSVLFSISQSVSIANLPLGPHQIKMNATNAYCSQDVISNFTIIPSPPKPVITQNLAVLTSSAAANNQWYVNGNAIAGATNISHTAILDGWYYVEVTDPNGCTNASDSIYMLVSSIVENQNNSGVKLIPNPATSSFEVWGLKFEVNDEIIITDAVGKIVYELKISESTSNMGHTERSRSIQTSNFSEGFYFVNVKTKTQRLNLKLVKL